MNLPTPKISGDAGIGELLAVMREPSYLKLAGKAMGTGVSVGLFAKRFPQMGVPMALMAGIYLGLEFAAWMEEDAQRKRGPVIDVTLEEVIPARTGLTGISPTNRDDAMQTLNFEAD